MVLVVIINPHCTESVLYHNTLQLTKFCLLLSSDRGWLRQCCRCSCTTRSCYRLLLWQQCLPILRLLTSLLYIKDISGQYYQIINMYDNNIDPFIYIKYHVHTKFSMMFIRVKWNPNDTPNCLSVLSSRFRNTSPLIRASNIKWMFTSIIEAYMILPSSYIPFSLLISCW